MAETTMRTSGGDPVAVPEDRIAALEAALRGMLVRPSDPAYDDARAVWNGMIDRRPALIVRCAGTADVMAAVTFAREHGLLVAVRGGGHNVSGNAVCDGGLVVDLSAMRDVRVDPEARTVRAQGGATIGDLDHETQAFGLAVPMGVVTGTGIAGLTLGGGLGWLRRRWGLSCDALVSADVVTPDGSLVTASAERNADLFWGIRGGGGNFGVVTSFEYRAYPVGPEVFLAFVIHPAEDAAEAVRAYAEWAVGAPDEVSSFGILWHGPQIDEIPAEHHGRPIVVYLAAHSGDPAGGERVLAGLRGLGSPVADLSGAIPYLQLQQFFDADYPAREKRYYWKSRYLSGLPAEAIDLLVELNEAAPSPHSTLDIWQLGGAFARVGPEETAFGDRSAPFLLGIEANWESPDEDEECLRWAREAHRALERFSTGGEYVNFPGLYEDAEGMVRGTFGDNMGRLVALKRRYDPGNLFRLNHNVRPG